MTRINMQQMPKDLEFLRAFTAPKDFVLVSLDFSSVEDIVLAEFSQDASLLAIYGPGRPPNCGYLFLAAHIPSMSADVRKHYDPHAARRTEVELEQIKRVLKRQRSLAKPVKLACAYNALPAKVQEQCHNYGFPVTLEEAKRMWEIYWELHAGVRAFSEQLEAEVRSTGGYFLNGRGRPIAVERRKIKDVCNSFCQSTAHDLLLTYIMLVDILRVERQIPMRPWLVDFHDETDWVVPVAYAEAARQVLVDALALLNERIQPLVPIRGTALIAQSLADIKR